MTNFNGLHRLAIIRTNHNATNNVYVQSRTLDGEPFESQTLNHERLEQGGTSAEELGSMPKIGAR